MAEEVSNLFEANSTTFCITDNRYDEILSDLNSEMDEEAFEGECLTKNIHILYMGTSHTILCQIRIEID